MGVELAKYNMYCEVAHYVSSYEGAILFAASHLSEARASCSNASMRFDDIIKTSRDKYYLLFGNAKKISA